MKIKRLFITVLALISLQAYAGSTDPLFINLTTDDSARSTMALTFGKHHFANGHPLSIFLNDKAIMFGVKAGADKYPSQQKEIAELVSKGGLVIVCPMCLRNAGFTEADLLPGVKLGGPQVTGEALFKDGTKTMSW